MKKIFLLLSISILNTHAAEMHTVQIPTTQRIGNSRLRYANPANHIDDSVPVTFSSTDTFNDLKQKLENLTGHRGTLFFSCEIMQQFELKFLWLCQ